ncbi:MAG: cell division protein FtsX [Acidimicrobiia bacterium]
MALKVDYVTRETLTNLRRNLLLSTASVLTVAVSLSMVGAVLFLRYGVDNATARWKNGVEFEIFFTTDPPATTEQKDRVYRELSESDEVDVSGIQFIDQAAQYELFRVYFVDQPEFLENVKQEDMPESYRVRPSVDDADLIQALGDRFTKEPGVYKVAFAKDQVKRAFDTSRGLQIGMSIVATVLFLASSLLIFNTLRTAIFSRRREIEVMKLVGATNWFIRVPFMIEGMLQGLVGSEVTFAALFWLRSPLAKWVVDTFDQFAGFAVVPSEVFTIGVLMVVVGSLVGAVSAGVAVTRFLDV